LIFPVPYLSLAPGTRPLAEGGHNPKPPLVSAS